jgi:hypothetical protein
MTKIGENDNPPKIAKLENYQKDLAKNALKFESALSAYTTSTGDEKARLKTLMDGQLQLIQSAVNEIKTKGMSKQSDKLATDYKNYMNFNSDENFAAVEQDLQTLREMGQI